MSCKNSCLLFSFVFENFLILSSFLMFRSCKVEYPRSTNCIFFLLVILILINPLVFEHFVVFLIILISYNDIVWGLGYSNAGVWPPHQHATVPWRHCAPAPPCHRTTATLHHMPWRHRTKSPRCHCATLLPCYLATLLSCYLASLLPRHHATVPPRHRATAPPRHLSIP
jgi:hypothetical protein